MRMKMSTHVVLAMSVMVLVGLIGTAQADLLEGTAYVGTVNGTGAFDVQNGGNQLYFRPQPDSEYVWMENNGSAPGTVATYNGAVRDGIKTFACTDLAYGQRLDSIKLSFDYFTGADPTTGINMVYYPAINVFITDGLGHYGVWSATSGGTAFTTTPVSGETGWSHLSLDLTNLTNNTWGQLNEYNGGVTTNRPYWDDIRDWTVAGFYDYQRTPEGGFEAWNSTLWGDITNVGGPDTTLNTYGITLNWGDTVGGMNGDGLGEIGAAAQRAYGQAGRLINDYTLTVGSNTYEMNFMAAPSAPVPEPASMGLLGLGLVGLVATRIRKRKIA